MAAGRFAYSIEDARPFRRASTWTRVYFSNKTLFYFCVNFLLAAENYSMNPEEFVRNNCLLFEMSADSLPARILPADSGACPANKLPDSILAKIFTYLSLKERFLACHVTKKWAAASRIPWSDITYLGVSSIPRAMLNPILALCPKVQQIHAQNFIILLSEGNGSLQICDQVRVLKLANVQFAMKGLDHNDGSFQKFKHLLYRFLARFPNLTELTWSHILAVNWQSNNTASACDNYSPPYSTRLMFGPPNSIVTSLKRLVVADSGPPPPIWGGVPIDLTLPHNMQALECLYVDHYYEAYGNILGSWLSQSNAPHLRELCFVSRSFPLEFRQKGGFRFEQLAEIVCQKHPRLEVLIYAGHSDMSPGGLSKIIETPHPSLRILVLSGTDLVLMAKHMLYEGDPQVTPTLPPRQSVSANDAARPLEIFAGGNFTQHVRFTHSPQYGIAHYHRIDCPMSQFLAKPDFESFFEGLWTAATLRDGPKNGLKEWGEGDPGSVRPFYSDMPLQFR